VTIAVVRDGPMPEEISTSVEAQLRQVAARDMELELVRSPQVPELDAQWDRARARKALQAALDDPDVDYVLAVGALVSQAAAEVPLTKPVVATFVQRPDFGRIHEQVDDRSQTENLAFLQLPQLIETDLATMDTLFPLAGTAHVLLPESYIGGSTVFDSEIGALEQKMGIRIEPVPLGDNASTAAARLSEEAVTAFVGRTPRWSASDRRELFEGLTERGVATYGLVGHNRCRGGRARGKNA
jgi:hypothetical protein